MLVSLLVLAVQSLQRATCTGANAHQLTALEWLLNQLDD